MKQQLLKEILNNNTLKGLQCHTYVIGISSKGFLMNFCMLSKGLLLLLLLSRFSRVRLCATPETAAHQAPPSLGFSRQEHWSGLPFPSPMHERKSESEVAQLCPTLSDPMDCSLPGSSVHGIFQARVLEWGAIAFTNYALCSTYFKFGNTILCLKDVPCSLGKGNS